MFLGAQVRNKKKKHTKNTQTKSQKIVSCITHAKEAHLTDQTDQRSYDTDVPAPGPTRQCTREGRWAKTARGGRPNYGFGRTPLKPVQVHFGGKLLLILLMAVWHVSMYEDCGNQPPQAIKGASHTTHHTHHLKASLSHSLVTCTP